MKSKQIEGFEYYLIYEDGRVQSLKYGKSKVKKLNLTLNGYYQVGLMKNGKQINKLVHRLVALHFIPNPENKPEVNHKDNNRQNNHISNLEWVTPKENMQHSSKQNRMACNNQRGNKNPNYKLTNPMVLVIKKLLQEKELNQTQIASIFNVSRITISRISSNNHHSLI